MAATHSLDSTRSVAPVLYGSFELSSYQWKLASTTARGQQPRPSIVQLGKKIYVLHAFQKKSKKGIETAKHDVDLIKQRYAEAKERAKHEEK